MIFQWEFLDLNQMFIFKTPDKPTLAANMLLPLCPSFGSCAGIIMWSSNATSLGGSDTDAAEAWGHVKWWRRGEVLHRIAHQRR